MDTVEIIRDWALGALGVSRSWGEGGALQDSLRDSLPGPGRVAESNSNGTLHVSPEARKQQIEGLFRAVCKVAMGVTPGPEECIRAPPAGLGSRVFWEGHGNPLTPRCGVCQPSEPQSPQVERQSSENF